MKRKQKFEEKYDTPSKRLNYYNRRYEAAKAVSILWAPLFKAAQHYTTPSRDLFWYGNQTQGQDKNWMIFDTIGVDCMNKAVAKTQLSLIPPHQTWSNLTAGMDIPEEAKADVTQQLSKMTEILFSYINHSNFATIGAEVLRDMICGTGVMPIDEGPDDQNPFIFQSIPPAQVSFEESINSRIESGYRTWGPMRVCDLESKWPEIELPNFLVDMMENDILAKVPNVVDAMIYMYGEKKPYRYVVWIDGHILLDQAEESQRWVISRWNRVGNEVNGRGPGIDALPSLLSLQRMGYLELRVAELKGANVYMGYDDGVFNGNSFKIEANTIIPIRPTQGNNYPLAPLPVAPDVSFKQLTVMDLRAQVRELFFSNPIGMPDDTPEQTATEIVTRQKSFAELVGPTFTRLQHEFLGPIIQRCLDILYRRGLLPKLKINGREVQVKYQSPLAVSQGIQNVDNFMGLVQRGTAIYGEMFGMFLNHQKIIPWFSQEMATNPQLTLNEEQIKQAFEEMSRQQDQAQQMAMMQSMGPAQGQRMAMAA